MNTPNEVPFQFYIQTIGRGQKRRRSLTQAEAKAAMQQILQGKVTDMQLGAFLMLIRVREETPEEAAGFVEALREVFETPRLPFQVDVDWGTYAGKRRVLPWYLLALQVLAQQGYKICLHGIVGNDSGRLYTQEVVQYLNWPIANALTQAGEILVQQNCVYVPVETFIPQIKTLMDHREELGLRSPVHTVARMLNPFNAKLSVHGVFHKGYDDLHQTTATLLNTQTQTLAFCGDAGEAEVRPDKQTEIKVANGVQHPKGHKNDQAWSFLMPKTFENADPTSKEMQLDLLKAVWLGQAENAFGLATVLQTLAMALVGLEDLSPEQALLKAQQLWQAREKTA